LEGFRDRIDRIHMISLEEVVCVRSVGLASGDGGFAFDASICAYPPCVRSGIGYHVEGPTLEAWVYTG